MRNPSIHPSTDLYLWKQNKKTLHGLTRFLHIINFPKSRGHGALVVEPPSSVFVWKLAFITCIVCSGCNGHIFYELWKLECITDGLTASYRKARTSLKFPWSSGLGSWICLRLFITRTGRAKVVFPTAPPAPSPGWPAAAAPGDHMRAWCQAWWCRRALCQAWSCRRAWCQVERCRGAPCLELTPCWQRAICNNWWDVSGTIAHLLVSHKKIAL